jgi:hypothetical protein
LLGDAVGVEVEDRIEEDVLDDSDPDLALVTVVLEAFLGHARSDFDREFGDGDGDEVGKVVGDDFGEEVEEEG